MVEKQKAIKRKIDKAASPPERGWAPELTELAERKALVQAMGGPERIERQHAAGRMTVRERIDALLDPGSFQEVGSIAGAATYDENGKITDFLPANCVFGRGSINGQRVVVEGDDFTVRGGAADAAIWTKLLAAETIASQYRIPIVRMLEGSGGGGSVRSIEKYGRANVPNGVGTSTGIHLCVENLGIVPVVGLGLGSIAGLGSARLAISHYSMMVRDTSAVFVAGPPVVERLGETRTKQELGGWEVQVAAGAVDDVVDSEQEAFERTRQFLSYLPNSVWEQAERKLGWDPVDREEDYLSDIVPRDRGQVYNMRRIIDAVADQDTFFEMGKYYGRPIITGFARLDGWTVAVMAGDPMFGGGAWNAEACQKITRFVDMAETFHIPVVHLVDCPGFQVGLAAEKSGLMRHGVRAISAINQSTIPWCSVIIRNMYGVGGGAHQPHRRLCMRYAWPSASWGSLPLEGGIEAGYRADLEAAEDPVAKLCEIEDRLNAIRSPFRSAEPFWIEEIIDPLQTRKLLCEFANLSASLFKPGAAAFQMRP